MSKILNLHLEQNAFGQLDLKANGLKPIQITSHSIEKFLRGTTIDDDAIEVTKTYLPEEITENNRHQPTKRTGGARKAEEHPGELEQASSSTEYRPLLCPFCHTQLPISTEKVECGEVFSFPKIIKSILNVWNRVSIFLSNSIDPTIVYTKMKRSIFLSHKTDRRSSN